MKICNSNVWWCDITSNVTVIDCNPYCLPAHTHVHLQITCTHTCSQSRQLQCTLSFRKWGVRVQRPSIWTASPRVSNKMILHWLSTHCPDFPQLPWSPPPSFLPQVPIPLLTNERENHRERGPLANSLLNLIFMRM